MSDTQKFVVVCVYPNQTSRIAATASLDGALRNWTQRYGVFLPVVAFRTDLPAFMELAQIPRLPKTAPTEWVADLLHRAPVELAAQPAVFRHFRRLGPKAAPLLVDWARAVKEVHCDSNV